jgi:hypothetical protein
LEELQRISNYRMVRKRLRAGAVTYIIAGAVFLWLGINGNLKADPFMAGVAGIGGFLLLRAGWMFASPMPGVKIFDGCGAILLAAWCISITVRGGGSAYYLGIALLGWAFRSFRDYARMRRIPVREPSPELLERIEEIAKQINKSNPTTDGDIIELLDRNSFYVVTEGGEVDWKGRLAPDHAIFVDGSGKYVIFATREDVTFTPRGNVRPKRWAAGTFRIGSQELKGEVSPESLQRYQAWKERGAEPVAEGEPAV